jgi:site-specific recombinase XerD
MNDSRSARSKTAGARVPEDWQPRYLGGWIDEITWNEWRLDPDRPLADLARAHLRHCRDRSLARKTVEGYDRVAASFIRFVERESADSILSVTRTAVVGDLSTETIYRYLNRSAARSGGSLTLGAQASEGGALKGLASFGIEIGAVAHDALRAFKLPKPDEDAVPTSLSDADTPRLDRNLSRDMSYEGCRLHLWCPWESKTQIRDQTSS